MWNYVAFKELRTFAFKLIFYLALADAGVCISNLMNFRVLCVPQAVTQSFFGFASAFWVLIIASTINEVVLKRNFNVQDSYSTYHKFVWGTSTILAILPFVKSSYGDAGYWCWLKTDEWGFVWRAVTYIVLWCIFIFISIIYYRVSRVPLRSSSIQEPQPQSNHSVLRRMKFYPMIFFISTLFASIRRGYNLIMGEESFYLVLLHVFFSGLQGLFNALIYGLTPKVLETDQKFFEKWRICCCCRRQRHDFEPDSPLLDNLNIEPHHPSITSAEGQFHVPQIDVN